MTRCTNCRSALRAGALIAGLALGLSARAAQAQDRGFTVGGGPLLGVSTGTFGTYLSTALGAGATVRWHRAPVGLALDVDYAQFRTTTVGRPYPGTAATIDIATAMRSFTIVAGPALAVRHGRLLGRVSAGAGILQGATTATLSGLGDPTYFSRSTTFDDLTWALAFGASTGVQVGTGRHPIRLGVEGRYVRTGDVRLVREEGLRAGVISGLYLPATPTPASYVLLRLLVTVGVGPATGQR